MQSENELYSYFAYIGPFWFIGMTSGSRNRDLRFHLNQGLVLFITEICAVVSVFCINGILDLIDGAILSVIALWLGRLLWLGTAALFFWLSVTGMLNVAREERRPLPFIGGIKLLDKSSKKSSSSRRSASSRSASSSRKTASSRGPAPSRKPASSKKSGGKK